MTFAEIKERNSPFSFLGTQSQIPFLILGFLVGLLVFLVTLFLQPDR